MAEKIFLLENSKLPLRGKTVRKKILNWLARFFIGSSVYTKYNQACNKQICLSHLTISCLIINFLAKIMGLKAVFYDVTYLRDINKEVELLILDDCYPLDLYAWRKGEYDALLKHFSNSCLLRCNTSVSYAYQLTSDKCLDRTSKKIFFMNDGVGVFLNDNIKLVSFLMYYGYKAYNIEEINKDFVITLYPSGGFKLYDKESLCEIKKICMSPHFKHMIVTQKVMYRYVLNNKICPKEKVSFIFAGPSSPVKSNKHRIINKVVNICFCSNVYGDRGWRKGYDIFVSVAKILNKKNKSLKFHVVGSGISEKTVNISDIKDNFIFYGNMHLKDLTIFFENIDIMIMPNRLHFFNDGSMDFDGFPLGCAAHGMMCGVPLFMTDPLDLNDNYYEDGNDFIKINNDPYDISKKIGFYIDNPIILNKIGQNGNNKTRKLFSYENQIVPRIKIYEEILKKYRKI